MTNEFKGVNHGRTLLKQSSNFGGRRYVFVIQGGGGKNNLVNPTTGCRLMNPFRGAAKAFAGDLVEYRLEGVGYILKTYEVESVSGNTVNIVRSGYRHIPFVGDKLGVAPTELDGDMTSATITAVNETKIGDVKVWACTFDSALEAEKGDILVEAGEDDKMLVKNPNMVLPWDLDFIFVPSMSNDDYDNARYLFDPVLSELAFTHRMSPIPPCVMKLNRSRVVGWFQI